MAKSKLGIVKYIEESLEDFRKVTWPTRQQTIQLFIIVVIITLLVIAYIGVLDWIFAEVYKLLVR